MSGIYLSIALVLALALSLFLVTHRLARRLSRRMAVVLLVVGIALLILFEWKLADNLLLARLVPISNVVILGNLTPVLIAWTAAMAWRAIVAPAWRKSILLFVLVVLGVWRSYGWLAKPLPPLHDRWAYGVCRQTSDASCSPAAAATLLSAYGVETSESEMADLSLTRSDGTPMLGLYRGLRLKTEATGVSILPFHTDVAGLREMKGPVLLSVGLPRFNHAPAIYHSRWGWRPGVRHTVVLYGFTPEGKLDIADPAIGRERWAVDALQILWQGDGIAIHEGK